MCARTRGQHGQSGNSQITAFAFRLGCIHTELSHRAPQVESQVFAQTVFIQFYRNV